MIAPARAVDSSAKAGLDADHERVEGTRAVGLPPATIFATSCSGRGGAIGNDLYPAL